MWCFSTHRLCGFLVKPSDLFGSVVSSEKSFLVCAGRILPFGRKAPNSFHLFDMSGNVLEWCWDSAILDGWCYAGESLYSKHEKTNPIISSSSPARILRGGRWNYGAVLSRISERTRSHPCYRYNYMGFRVARSHPKA